MQNTVNLTAPDINNSFYHTCYNNLLSHNTIFVFGSNLAGRHGKGAANEALLNYGAVYGRGIGLQGRSYAIPTKDKYLNVLSLDVIKKYVEDFIEETRKLERFYYVTPIGTGLAGYKDNEIAPMFNGVRNCWLPDTWKEYLK